MSSCDDFIFTNDEIDYISLGCTIGYGAFMCFIFIVVSVKGYRDIKFGKDDDLNQNLFFATVDIDDDKYKDKYNKVKTEQKIQKTDCWSLFKRWLWYTWKIRVMYMAVIVHIYDISTDIGVLLEWGLIAYNQRNNCWDNDIDKEEHIEINMTALVNCAFAAFMVYRVISSAIIYRYTKRWSRFLSQFFDFELFRIIYINHKLKRQEPGNLHRFLSKLEAIFESSPQAILQIVYLVKTTRGLDGLVFSSLIFSLISVASRFISDDKVFYNDTAKALGFGFRGDTWGSIGWNNGFIIRYLWRLSDVLARIIILSFVWIVLGGEVLSIILGCEIIMILIVIIFTGREVSYDYLQYIFATYIAGKNFRNGFCNLLYVMKYSILYRGFENLLQMTIITMFLFGKRKIFMKNCLTCETIAYQLSWNDLFGRVLFIIAWTSAILYVVLFVIMMKKNLWTDVLKINKDRDISKCAYHIEAGDWKKGTFDINADRDVIKVALRGDLLTVKEMLAYGYDIHNTDENGRSLLHHLCFNQVTDIETMNYIMIDCGCKEIVNKKGTLHGQAPIHYFIWANKDLSNDGKGQIQNFINIYGADPQLKDDDDNTLLHFASRNRHAFTPELTVFLCDNYNMDMNKTNKFNQCPFHFYLRWNKHAKLEFFAIFTKTFNLNFDIIDTRGWTIMHWAVSNWKGKCKPDMVEFIINNGGQKYLNYKTKKGETIKDILLAQDDLPDDIANEVQQMLIDYDPIDGKKVAKANIDETIKRFEKEKRNKMSIVVEIKDDVKETDTLRSDKNNNGGSGDGGGSSNKISSSDQIMIELGAHQQLHTSDQNVITKFGADLDI